MAFAIDTAATGDSPAHGAELTLTMIHKGHGFFGPFDLNLVDFDPPYESRNGTATKASARRPDFWSTRRTGLEGTDWPAWANQSDGPTEP